ncbi:hypothetical protein DYU11_07205 [Fibrisoma montanum]|uniref:Uncharacterized protein n=1 Tax=Fibrisoma montanum TaxID=2305895 RepID=A0A418ME52_9BACT|nr:hypothetical protein [Fibrisoma montanum]RIV25099.1 hypothetical protein DYU11_07205 [Fibrisoma montanum]
MTTKQLRQAIARLYPDTYSRWSWKRLLADFVDRHLKAYIEEVKRAIVSGHPIPVIPDDLRAAAPLLARQQQLTYDELALSCYMLQLELETARQERDHLKRQADRMHTIAINSQQVAEESVTLLKNLTNWNPDSRLN